jgi:hypothetical protein
MVVITTALIAAKVNATLLDFLFTIRPLQLEMHDRAAAFTAWIE